jgi:hypothetical protein
MTTNIIICSISLILITLLLLLLLLELQLLLPLLKIIIILIIIIIKSEEILKYKDFIIEIQRLWNVKAKVIPVIIGVTGTIL